jgi:hypothetical protein
MSKHKHHIIPKYHCKKLGIDPDFDENYVMVERLDHARIHWGYKCDDLEPLFEYITPKQWIIDLIPRGDNRDAGAAVLTAKGEIDDIDISGKNHPQYKHGRAVGLSDNPEARSLYMKAYQQTPEYKARVKAYRQTPEYKEYQKAYQQTPEYKEYQKAYRQTPEHKEYMREYFRTNPQEYDDERKEYNKKRNQTPERKEYMREYYARKKAEGSTTTQSKGTLEPFLK